MLFLTSREIIYDLKYWSWQRSIKHYQEVVFMDSATGAKFVAGSTLKPEETVEFEGKTYPLVRVEISSDSHPFYTGKQKFAQADGRIEKFNKKYGMSSKN